MNKILVLITGGTIDSYFDHISESIRVCNKSAAQEYLEGLKIHAELEFQEICIKDSRDLDDGDRKKIVMAIRNTSCDKILVLHGTYTMPATAEYLEKYTSSIKGKTIMLTGAMKPMEGFMGSDAPFNLGFSIASLLFCPEKGVFVAMNGKVFPIGSVYKNLKNGRFEDVINKESNAKLPEVPAQL